MYKMNTFNNDLYLYLFFLNYLHCFEFSRKGYSSQLASEIQSLSCWPRGNFNGFVFHEPKVRIAPKLVIVVHFSLASSLSFCPLHLSLPPFEGLV